MDDRLRWAITAIGLSLMLLTTARLLSDPDALRDESDSGPKPFSFARVQLLFWTNVVVSAWLVVWGRSGEFWALNPTCLALLGIGAATSVGGRILDARDIADPRIIRHQDGSPSRGFFTDILSDAAGVSIHRYQALVFNIAHAVSFLLTTLERGQTQFPSLDGSTLALLGMSAGTYLAMKSQENAANAARLPLSLAASSDELLDPGAYDDGTDER